MKEYYLNSIWSLALSNPKRIKELAKCQVLCRKCHDSKSRSEITGTLREKCRREHPLVTGNIYRHPKTGQQECLQCKKRRKREETERLRNHGGYSSIG